MNQFGAYYVLPPSAVPVGLAAVEDVKGKMLAGASPLAGGLLWLAARAAGGYVVGKYTGTPVLSAAVAALAPMPIVGLGIVAWVFGEK